MILKEYRHCKRVIVVLGVLLFCGYSVTGCSATRAEDQQESLKGPLDEYLSEFYDEKALEEDYSSQRIKQTESAVAACMKAEGFDYTPNLEPEGGRPQMRQETEVSERTPLEFAKEFGYGIVEQPEESQASAASAEPQDPNLGYYNSLTKPEQDAYDKALFGSVRGGAEGIQEGCARAVAREYPGYYAQRQSVLADPEFKDSMDLIEGFYTALQSNEELKALDAKWRVCVERAGVERAETPQQLMQRFSDDYNSLLYPKGEGSDAVELSDSARRAFQDLEIQAAVADSRCQDEVKYQQAVERITFEAEEKFVQEHKAQLDTLLAKLKTKSK